MTTIADNGNPPGATAAETQSLNFTPESMVTVPERTDWHLVADHELDTLSSSVGGILGSVGFAALGAALGAAPQAFSGWGSINAGKPLSSESATSLCIFLLSIATTIICLSVFAAYKKRTVQLTANIRLRPKRRGAIS